MEQDMSQGVCLCVCRNTTQDSHKNSKLINLKDINSIQGNW